MYVEMVGTFQNWNPNYQNKFLRSRLENECQSIVNHQDSKKKGKFHCKCILNLIFFVEYEIHFDCFLSKELLGMDDWPSMEQRNQRQVRYPSGKVRNQVAVDINFLKYQCECPRYFGGKESIPGGYCMFLFPVSFPERDQVTHTQIYCTSTSLGSYSILKKFTK